LLGRTIDRLLGWFFHFFNRTFERTKNIYLKVLERLIRRSFIVLVLYAALLVLTGYMFRKVPTGFIPEIDQGVIFVNVELPEGASLERTEKVMNKIEGILKSTPVSPTPSIASGVPSSPQAPLLRAISLSAFSSRSKSARRIRRSPFAVSSPRSSPGFPRSGRPESWRFRPHQFAA
jgi:multidrug efflux pump subunit AcrB